MYTNLLISCKPGGIYGVSGKNKVMQTTDLA